ncbi:MAG TPA: hypothetical protein VKZ49_16950, partial [Polyangiaceae bacterium]|nr:hypothetical protein [Polyangiaceae bacterium]
SFTIDDGSTSAIVPGTRVSLFAPHEAEETYGVFSATEWIADVLLPRSTAFLEARAATPQEALDKLAELLPKGTFTSLGGST